MTALLIIGIYLSGVIAAWFLQALLYEDISKDEDPMYLFSWMLVVGVILGILITNLPKPSLKYFKKKNK